MAAQSEVVIYGPKFQTLTPDYFSLQVPLSLKSYRDVITAVKANSALDWDNAIQPLEEAAEHLSNVWSQLEHLNAVVNTTEIRKVYDELLPIVTSFQTELMQDEDVYNIYLKTKNSSGFQKLSHAQQIIIDNELRDFKLSGVNLDEKKRKEFKTLVERLSDLENKFSNNVLDATEGWTYHVKKSDETILDGIPKRVLESAESKAQELGKDGWLLTLDFPCYYAVMSNAKNRDLRYKFYRAYNTRASDQAENATQWDNTNLISEILMLRQQIAQLAGYKDYAEYSLVPKMASNLDDILKFIHNLTERAKPKAQKELEELQKFATNIDAIKKLEAWDVSYYSEQFKIKKFDISDEALRVYFPEPRVLTGLFKLVRTIFGLEIEEVTGFHKWHDSVRMFKVSDNNNIVRGYFYTDLYARVGKRGGAWMAECISRIKFANNLLQLPIAYLNCNFAAPTATTPGLLTHDDVVTLFHEFGHTLHHILTQVDYYSVAGINGVAWDAVELPSQFMENWCWQWPVIQDISENIETGEPLPRTIYDKLLATKNYQAALGLMRQIEFTLFDLRIHAAMQQDNGKSVQKILDDVRKDVCVIPVPDFNRFQNSFSHIFAGGYSAGYYSYLWAEVLSCDAFAIFSVSDMFSIDVGRSFMSEILEMGGSKPAMDLFKAFAGREPEVDALLKHHAIV